LIVQFINDAARDFVPELPRRYVGGFYDNLQCQTPGFLSLGSF
jgi:hypothetical protein